MTRIRRWFWHTRAYATWTLWRGHTVVYRARIENGVLTFKPGDRGWVSRSTFTSDREP